MVEEEPVASAAVEGDDSGEGDEGGERTIEEAATEAVADPPPPLTEAKSDSETTSTAEASKETAARTPLFDISAQRRSMLSKMAQPRQIKVKWISGQGRDVEANEVKVKWRGDMASTADGVIGSECCGVADRA